MDLEFLEKYIPHSEMRVIKGHPEAYRDELERVESQIRAIPALRQIAAFDAGEIRIGMHYFGGATDIWVYALEGDEGYADAFVCLNGDTENAECGSVYIPEFLDIPLMNLDLHWDSSITLKDVMEKVKDADPD